MTTNHLLYSYRRCPYAMRARMALISANIQCDVIEIDFKDKPQAMLDISPKGTIPVLQTTEGDVIDESLDIMHWALNQNDPNGLLQEGANELIAQSDGPFKAALDRYKYPNRFPDEDCTDARDNALEFIKSLDDRLNNTPQLLGDKISVADLAIFPFIRQFANVDKTWFDKLPYTPLHNWLQANIDSDLFQKIFKKQGENPYLLI
jgi:glutathione S-transferase